MILIVHTGDRIERYTVNPEELDMALDSLLCDPFLERIEACAESDPLEVWTVYDVTD